MNNRLNKVTAEKIEVCLLAGKIMMQSGGETYRVEDTMARMAASLGMPNASSYVTPTGILFSTEGTEPAKLIRITNRTTDLQKVNMVNTISRALTEKRMTAEEAYRKLKQIDAANHTFPIWVQIIAASIASACFMIMFQGPWTDFLASLVTGGFGFLSFVIINRFVQVKFFSEFTASFIIGLLAFLFVSYEMGHEADKIIIGSVMPLVPGLLITNAVRDLMAGHLVSGLSKGAEAFLTSFAIGTGIALVFTIF
ncbi:threonine/serine exporter family protein [Paenibacillus sp. N1-5-1-14]|uniref:threonine/serine exporter family protein n=1 Tax=Paenibacillus radicibacter TaxID=2972488 RepID=UPI0021599E5B|nr:threonine/serine exporter family protein [Paenibacillus radicibacter]MCR8644661.1 threonine/serine exporter family protein [Paenibacillus radicibacter]